MSRVDLLIVLGDVADAIRRRSRTRRQREAWEDYVSAAAMRMESDADMLRQQGWQESHITDYLRSFARHCGL